MRNFQIIKFSLILFLMLFVSIYYIENYIDKETIKISDITNNNLNKYVNIEAMIVKQRLLNTTLFLELKDNTSQIKAVMFNIDTELEENKNYLFEGKVTKYKGELELIIYKISIN